jgi:Holliday junction resolvase RusA-like endonuclease
MPGGERGNVVQKFVIPGNLPGLNLLIAANRANRYKGAKLKRDADMQVVAAIRKCHVGAVRWYPVEVRIWFYEKDKRRDIDNVYSGGKYVLDGLQEAGILRGDGQKYVDCLRYIHCTDPHNPRVEVEIIENDID